MPSYGWRKQPKCIFDLQSASRIAEFEISEFEISRVDCTFDTMLTPYKQNIISKGGITVTSAYPVINYNASYFASSNKCHNMAA